MKPKKVPYKKAVKMIFRGSHNDTHTFRGFIGANWPYRKLLAHVRKYGVELSGPQATAMNHGLVLIDEHGPLFIETRSQP